MDTKKEAEQLYTAMKRLYTNHYMAEDIQTEEQKKEIELILQSFERICREQRKADLKKYKEATNVRLSLIGKAIIMEMEESPLLTDK